MQPEMKIDEMLYTLAVGLFAACVVSLLLLSPAQRAHTVSGEVSVSQAERLVDAWLDAHKDQCHHNDHPKLKEITTAEMRSRLHAQLFRVCDATYATFDAYLVKAGEVYPMSMCFGGWGLMQTCVFDIDRDLRDELIYVYSFGSGIHRSVVEAYRFDGQTPTRIPTVFAVTDDIRLEKRKGHIDIYLGNRRLGELIVRGAGKERVLDIEPEPGLPKDLEKKIWKLPLDRADLRD